VPFSSLRTEDPSSNSTDPGTTSIDVERLCTEVVSQLRDVIALLSGHRDTIALAGQWIADELAATGRRPEDAPEG
jgi:hypothetical protein